jgi:cobyrinic acid a,c-diamide synthase
MRVQTFKVGPDFLDPTYLAIASERPCYNLDGWMAGREYCRRLFERTTADADVVIVEGVMGLFDGADPQTSEGSTAEIARLLDIPIVLVTNVHGMARSFAALVHGYTTFEPGLRFSGIIANHSGSARHAEWLSLSLEAAGLPPLLGAIQRGAFPDLPSRHLGLVTADQTLLSDSILHAMADVVNRNVDMDKIFTAGALPSVRNLREATPGAGRPVVGIARDAAFHFYYADLLDELTEAGCELAFFSPLSDRSLPDNISGLYIGGGYPELYSEKLSSNGQMLDAIRTFADSGQPLYAECGGLMYLSRGIETDGVFHPLVGVLPARTKMRSGKKALGYVEVTLTRDSLWGSAGEKLRGHEFHYSELIDDPTETSGWEMVYTVKRQRSEQVKVEGFQCGAILASYIHLHLASRPAAMERFVNRLARGKHSEE